MKNIIAILALLALTGCVQVSGTRAPDGTLTVNTHRFFWASEGIAFTLTEATNKTLSATLSVQKSSVDAAALQAVAQGVAAGMVQGAK